MSAFTEQIDDGPVTVPTLELFQGELSGFSAPQTAPEQYGENGTIPFADQRFSVWASEHVLRYFCAESVPEPHAQTLSTLHAANTGG